MPRDYPRGGPDMFGMDLKVRGSARTGLGRLLEGMARDDQRTAFKQTRERMVALGADRLNRIGTPRSQWLSRYYQSDPKGFIGFVNQFGGMPQLEQRLRDEAASQVVSKYMEAPESEQGPGMLLQSLIEATGDPDRATIWAQRIEASRKKEPRKILKDATGRNRFVPEDVGQDYVWDDTEGKGNQKDLSEAAKRRNRQIDWARKEWKQTVRKHGINKAQARRIAAGSDETFAARVGRATDFEGEETYFHELPRLSRLIKLASERKDGGDPGHDEWHAANIGYDPPEKLSVGAGGIETELKPGTVYETKRGLLRYLGEDQWEPVD